MKPGFLLVTNEAFAVVKPLMSAKGKRQHCRICEPGEGVLIDGLQFTIWKCESSGSHGWCALFACSFFSNEKLSISAGNHRTESLF